MYNIINSNNLSKLYSYVNSKLNHTSSIPPLMKTDGSLAITDRDKCNVLNDYFASVFTIDNENRQLFVPFSKKVPVNYLAIIVWFLLPVFVAK